MNVLREWLCAMLLATAGSCASAHDSWLVHEAGGWQVVTGTRYPRVDLHAPADSLAGSGCTEVDACWAELHEFYIELDPKLVQVYFRDAQPSPEVRERWAALHSEGKPWRERYRKFMRCGMARDPLGMDLEIVPQSDTPAVGRQARFVLLSRKEPVANQPVELVSERNPVGIWSRTNERGEVQWQLPFGGQWLVRTILIETDGAEAFKSRFATLVFDAS